MTPEAQALWDVRDLFTLVPEGKMIFLRELALTDPIMEAFYREGTMIYIYLRSHSSPLFMVVQLTHERVEWSAMSQEQVETYFAEILMEELL